MRGLLFGVRPEGEQQVTDDASPQFQALATTPMRLTDMPDPVLPADDWILLRTRLCGICGSDAKQVFMDGDADSSMTALISFPQVLGHELVADVVEAGRSSGRRVGERVVLNPWLSCGPRGLPLCAACREGDLSLCHGFADGHLPPGIHTGNSSGAPGGFGELVPAHTSMAVACPDVPDEVAVLADPFAVSLHAVLRNPPPTRGRVVVYGAGALGLTTCAVLELLHPDVSVAAVARYPHQAELARRHGALPLAHTPPADLVGEIGEWAGGVLRKPWEGLPWLHPGGADVVYDTVGTPETLEVGVRVLRARGRLVLTGVSAPGRFEWSPWYFKELVLAGSNAFGVETLGGVRRHAIEHYLELARTGRVDVGHLLTHTFRLEDWRAAFAALADQGASSALKVAFDYR